MKKRGTALQGVLLIAEWAEKEKRSMRGTVHSGGMRSVLALDFEIPHGRRCDAIRCEAIRCDAMRCHAMQYGYHGAFGSLLSVIMERAQRALVLL